MDTTKTHKRSIYIPDITLKLAEEQATRFNLPLSTLLNRILISGLEAVNRVPDSAITDGIATTHAVVYIRKN